MENSQVLFLNPLPMYHDDVISDVFYVGLLLGFYYPGVGFCGDKYLYDVFSGTYDECCDYLDNYKSEHGSYIWKEQP